MSLILLHSASDCFVADLNEDVSHVCIGWYKPSSLHCPAGELAAPHSNVDESTMH